MKYLFLFLSTSVIYSSSAQFLEDFNRSDLNEFNNWSGETTKFIIENGVLRLYDSLKSGKAYISRPSKSIENAVWKWDFKMDFNPSSSNYLDIFFACGQPAPEPSMSGYFVRLGSTKDNISLYYTNGLIEEKIIEGIESRLDRSSVSGTVRVQRDSIGNWILESKVLQESEFQIEGTSEDQRIVEANYFLVKCNYTSTRSDKFYLDNIEISGYPFKDRIKPKLLQLSVEDERNIWISFNETIVNGEDITSYMLQSTGQHPATIIERNEGFQLIFLEDFKNGKLNELRLSGILDMAGNRLDTVTFFRYIQPKNIHLHDLVISEVMSDPIPEQGLSNEEYIELYNRTQYPLRLDGLGWYDENSGIEFVNMWIDSLGYILLKPEKPGVLSSDNIYYLDNWPTLNNDSDKLFLMNQQGSIIDSLYYERKWHSPEKADGGWSLERKSVDSHCGGPENWASSENDEGGTPGLPNSVQGFNTDTLAPELLDTWYDTTKGHLNLEFSEFLYPTEGSGLFIEGEIVEDWQLSGNTIILPLKFDPSRDKLYEIRVIGFKDCSGNEFTSISAFWAKSSVPDFGDIIINEVLFETDNLGEEFIELYNASDHYIDINRLQLSIGMDGSDLEHYSLKSRPRLFYPKSYKVLSRNSERLRSRYPDLPVNTSIDVEMRHLNNIESSLVISASGHQIDSAYYHKDFHFALLEDTRNVSLERLTSESNWLNDQWTSSPSSIAYASPGRINSHRSDITKLDKLELTIQPGVIIPDNNGDRDFAQIQANLGRGNWAVSCWIYSSEGRPVKTLSNNRLSANSEIYFWDGIMDNGRRAPMGIYLVVMSATNINEIKYLRGTLAILNLN